MRVPVDRRKFREFILDLVHRRVHHQAMASLEESHLSVRVKWRLGGKRTGAPQTATFAIPPGDPPDAARRFAAAAKELVEARGHAITMQEVYDAILGTPKAVRAGVPTFAEWVVEWEAWRRRQNDAQSDTIDKYMQMVRQRMLPRLGHVPLTSISQDTVRDWVAWVIAHQRCRNGKPLAPETIRRAHAVLHQILGAAVGKWLAVNPAARIPGERKHRVGLPKPVPFEGIFLEPREVDLILSACSDRVRDIAYVLVRTGLRLGEILVLRVRDVVLDGKRPHVRVRRALKADGKIGPPKSAKSSREVTVSGEALAVLAPRVAGKKPNDLIFPTTRGHVWSENNLRRRHWLPAVAQAQRCDEHPPPEPAKKRTGPRRKLRIDEVSTCLCPQRLKRAPRMHDLRHTHVSLLVEAGWGPKRVQLRVGHSSYKVTMDVYGHLWDRPEGTELDAMERLLAMADDELA